MVWRDKVVWQEGMFLRAQHFQQQDRHMAHLLQARAAPLRAHPWGVTELAIDRNLLASGRFALSSAAGIMEDGTPFSIPETADPPVPLDLPEGLRNVVVHLALPLYQDGRPEVTASEDGQDAVRARFGLRLFEAFDTHSDSTIPAEIGVGRPRLRLMLATEDLAGYSCLGLTRIAEVPADRRVQLDDLFIPPCLQISAATVLSNFVAELVGMLMQRADVLAQRMGQPGVHGVADVGDFLLLNILNGWQPVLAHWADSGNVHPETLYTALAQLAGELATFYATDKRATSYPSYRHNDLQRSFTPVISDLRRYLGSDIVTKATRIDLKDRGWGFHTGAVMDRHLLRSAQFVLVVSADIPGEQLRRVFPNQVKVGAVEEIKQLVNVAVPGVVLRALPVAPKQIPFNAGAAYFELDRGSPYWQKMLNAGGFGIHVAGDFPNLGMQLWAIRG